MFSKIALGLQAVSAGVPLFQSIWKECDPLKYDCAEGLECKDKICQEMKCIDKLNKAGLKWRDTDNNGCSHYLAVPASCDSAASKKVSGEDAADVACCACKGGDKAMVCMDKLKHGEQPFEDKQTKDDNGTVRKVPKPCKWYESEKADAGCDEAVKHAGDSTDYNALTECCACGGGHRDRTCNLPGSLAQCSKDSDCCRQNDAEGNNKVGCVGSQWWKTCKYINHLEADDICQHSRECKDDLFCKDKKCQKGEDPQIDPRSRGQWATCKESDHCMEGLYCQNGICMVQNCIDKHMVDTDKPAFKEHGFKPFRDSKGNGCSWYADNGCTDAAINVPKDALSALDLCCVCDGGVKTQMCNNLEPQFKDEEKRGCAWYESEPPATGCDAAVERGEKDVWMTCCACGGGDNCEDVKVPSDADADVLEDWKDAADQTCAWYAAQKWADGCGNDKVNGAWKDGSLISSFMCCACGGGKRKPKCLLQYQQCNEDADCCESKKVGCYGTNFWKSCQPKGVLDEDAACFDSAQCHSDFPYCNNRKCSATKGPDPVVIDKLIPMWGHCLETSQCMQGTECSSGLCVKTTPPSTECKYPWVTCSHSAECCGHEKEIYGCYGSLWKSCQRRNSLKKDQLCYDNEQCVSGQCTENKCESLAKDEACQQKAQCLSEKCINNKCA